MLRRQILRYIQLVESDQYIGSLLAANDELVKALMAFEILDKSIDDDSDSENEGYAAPMSPRSPTAAMAGLSIVDKPNPPSRPARPAVPSGKQRVQDPESEDEVQEEDDDEDNPFSDFNAVSTETPFGEREGMTW